MDFLWDVQLSGALEEVKMSKGKDRIYLKF